MQHRQSMTASGKSDPERGKRLQALRKKSGLTQQKVAEELGTDKSSVSRWETGEVFPRDYLRQLSELYHAAPAYIAFGVEGDEDFVTYAAFDAFIDWLRSSPYEKITHKWMIEALRTMRMDLPADVEPTLETYKHLHQAMLTLQRGLKRK